MPPTFVFVRHGEAEHNVAFHENGVKVFEDVRYRDAPLTQNGKEQAIQTAKALSSFHILDMWSSPLTRCIQTAEEIIEETSSQGAYLHDSLLECLGGNHVCNERMTKKELQKNFPLWDTKLLPDIPMFYFERESINALHHRMLSFVLLIAQLYKEVSSDKHLVIVSHRDSIFALTGKELKNAEYIILTLDQILSRWNP